MTVYLVHCSLLGLTRSLRNGFENLSRGRGPIKFHSILHNTTVFELVAMVTFFNYYGKITLCVPVYFIHLCLKDSIEWEGSLRLQTHPGWGWYE